MILHQECTNLDLPTEDYDGVQYIIHLGDESGKLYAILRFEVVPALILIHPNILYPSIGNFKRLKKEMFKVGMPIMNLYKFEEAHFITHNLKLVRLIAGDKAELVGTAEGMPLYKYILGEV